MPENDKAEIKKKLSPSQKKEITRGRILEASRMMFAEKGFEATNVIDIAKHIGVANGTVYYYFKDKKAILSGLLDEFLDKLKSLVADWSRSSDTTPKAADFFIESLVRLLYENKELTYIVLKESFYNDPEVREKIAETYGYLRARTEDAMRLGIALGAVRPLDVEIAAVASLGMLKEVVFYALEKGMDIDLGRVIDEIAALQNYGLRPGHPGLDKGSANSSNN